jgi:tyrosyl-tRNA synthetase
MGHHVVLIVGDWTARIGDPSGQSVMRPMLTADEVRTNADTYMRQFFHVVDKGKTEVRWQSEWYDTFSLTETIKLAGCFTVAQMLQREDFRSRYEAQKPLGIHELFYPLLQAYDSVVIEADVEFGGTDQLFNLLVGRELQQDMGLRPQVCITMRLLVGTDGVHKMSKSLDNTIDLEDPPLEKFGKVMSLPDSALADYLELATNIPDEELAYIRKQLDLRSINPMEIKKRLAREVIGQFHGGESPREAEAEWVRVFSEREGPSKVPILELPLSRPATSDLCEINGDNVTWSLPKILTRSGLVPSSSQARRLLQEGAIEVDGVVQTSPNVILQDGATLRVGKHRFLRITDEIK